MKTGTVKFFNVSKGFGFITVDGSGQELRSVMVIKLPLMNRKVKKV
ncbi:MAG: Cold-shock DNA-binding domain [Bacteroidetes bacterium]|nr:Cold-shock DNA-binding domain [Bacteroidota bacterium]